MSAQIHGVFMEGSFLPPGGSPSPSPINESSKVWWTEERLKSVAIDALVTLAGVGVIVFSGGIGVVAAVTIVGTVHAGLKLVLDVIVPNHSLTGISQGLAIAAPIGRYAAVATYLGGDDTSQAAINSARAEMVFTLFAGSKNLLATPGTVWSDMAQGAEGFSFSVSATNWTATEVADAQRSSKIPKAPHSSAYSDWQNSPLLESPLRDRHAADSAAEGDNENYGDITFDKDGTAIIEIRMPKPDGLSETRGPPPDTSVTEHDDTVDGEGPSDD